VLSFGNAWHGFDVGIQLYTFAIISVLFIPCISTIAVLYQKLGARIAILASVYSVALGFFIGALINLLMK
jgi:ferrous iron transport protein B